MKCLPKAIDVYLEASHPICILYRSIAIRPHVILIIFEIGAQFAFVDKSELLGPCYFEKYLLNYTTPSSTSKSVRTRYHIW